VTIQLETPRKYGALIDQAHGMALNVLRPNSRKYDRAEHAYPKELDIVAAVIDGMNAATGGTAGATHTRRDDAGGAAVRNGGNLATVY
jgi:acyl-CoA dehydrogenase